MKKILQVFVLFLVVTNVFAQIKNPVKWKSSVEQLSDTEFNLVLNGTIEPEWHVYSQFTPDGGPLPMVLNFKDIKGNYELVGKTKESAYKKQFNEIFEVDEYYFEKSMKLTQKVKILNPKANKIKLNLEYQVCKEACINESKDFVFDIPVKESAVNPIATPVADSASVDTSSSNSKATDQVKSAPKKNEPVKKKENKDLWTIFLASFFGGFLALMTPCVFPLIPMTVSYFTKSSKTPAQGKKNALLYGISIILIYVLLGTVITAVFGAEALNALSTNVWFNVLFFIILIVFAISFLGAFEIVLPQSWANKMDQQAEKGGVLGILFMALALAIVSFSCTGPIVGDILFAAAAKSYVGPVIGMFGFSLALALPFMVFAFFPSWLQSLPKSGGWLNTVKVSLGFLELAFAFKFLSNADLVLQLHWLERETFLAIWIAIFGAWAIYLFGKITLPHDGQVQHISVGRLLLALLVSAFTIYMIPGLFGAPLKLISAFPPPVTYSESPLGIGFGGETSSKDGLPKGAKYGEHNIISFTDYADGLAYAKQVKKPVLIDFTGFACVNCRKMEINVWSDPKVLDVLKNKVVLISLYVDDKREMPKEEQFVSTYSGKEVITYGNKWTDFILSKYNTNTQPYYVLMDLEEKNLIDPISYTPDIDEYLKWLNDGISKF